MKTNFGTTLALTGVLLAGVSAAAVNTRALTASTKSSPVSVAATVLLPSASSTGSEIVDLGVPQSNVPDVNVTDASNQNSNATLAATPGVTVTTQPLTAKSTKTTVAQSPTVTYGNPNPQPNNGDDEGDDDGDDEGDDDGDDEGDDNDD